MRRFRPLATTAVAALAATTLAMPTTPGNAAAAYTVRTLHFSVAVGPDGSQTCDIVGDLYTPATASSTHRVPAILTTNGFGGSKDDQAGIGTTFATRGYEVLSYSGLGFGGSGCKITLDDPDYDGRAASQLVSFLGGTDGIAFADAAHTAAVAPLTVVVHDGTDHLGKHNVSDPRVGMIGGSYGGQIQFSAASVDARIDTIIPLITWNDLSYSLGPNNTAQTTGVSTSTPGTTKLSWGLLFSGVGAADGLQNSQGDPSRLYPCPNFADWVCPALATAGTTGYFQPSDIAALRHASVANYLSKIRIPVLLAQGENDTLFNLNEAVATYRALLAQKTPVKMIWQSWGHSQSTPAPGELSLANPDPTTQYETARFAAWFDRYLKGTSASTGPNFTYFRDWVSYSGIATPAYATSSTYPVGSSSTLYLSGDGSLVSSAADLTVGSQNLVTPPAGAPTTFDPIDALGSVNASASSLDNQPDQDAPGTAASWIGPVLTSPVDVAGSPTLTVRLLAPTAAATQALGPGGQLVLFVKVADVGPDGKAYLINGDVAPIRVSDVTRPVQVTLPAMVHRFAAGHQIKLVIAGAATNYRGGLTPTPVTIAAGDTGQALKLPVTQ